MLRMICGKTLKEVAEKDMLITGLKRSDVTRPLFWKLGSENRLTPARGENKLGYRRMKRFVNAPGTNDWCWWWWFVMVVAKKIPNYSSRARSFYQLHLMWSPPCFGWRAVWCFCEKVDESIRLLVWHEALADLTCTFTAQSEVGLKPQLALNFSFIHESDILARNQGCHNTMLCMAFSNNCRSGKDEDSHAYVANMSSK